MPSKEYSITLSRQLRSSKKKLQSSLTLSLPFCLQTLHPSWHISVHGGCSWGWWLFLIHLQGIALQWCSYRCSTGNCFNPAPSTLLLHCPLFSCFITKQKKILLVLPPPFHLRLLEPLIHTKISANTCFAARQSAWTIIPAVQVVSGFTL